MLRGVHLLLTYRCTHECDHCFVHAGPRARGTFTLEQVRALLDEVVRLRTQTVEWIYLEGGEPFLYYPLMLESLRLARERGFQAGVVTNAYWAESVPDARTWLAPLRDLGVADLSISDDLFHQEREGDQLAACALAAARELGIPCDTICVAHPSQAEGVRFRGRAADTLTADLPRQGWDTFTECPHEDLVDPERVHVDAFGHVHLCQGLSLGNAWETPFSELMRAHDARSHPIAGPLTRSGPAGLARELGLTPEPTAVSACHLCYRLRQQLRARFPDHLGPPQMYGEKS